MNEFKMGDVVTVAPGVFAERVSTMLPYEITKVPTRSNEVNYVATPKGGGRGVRAPAYAFVKFEGGYNEAAVQRAVAYEIPLDQGVVVTVNHPKLGTHLYVCTGTSRDGRTNRLVKLGGDGGRYWRIPTRLCTVVDVELLKVVAS